MSLAARIALILIVIVINVVSYIITISKGASAEKRCYNFLRLQAIFFPIIDLGTNAFGSTLGINTLAFILINTDIFRYGINWRQNKAIKYLIFIMLISAIFSGNIMNSIKVIPGYCIGFAVYLITEKAFSKSEFNINHILNLLKWIVFYIITFAVIQLFIYKEFTLFYKILQFDNRISSCMMDPQTAGVVIAIVFAFFWNSFSNLNKRRFQYLIICTALFLIGSLTGSKTFIIGIAAAIVLFTIYAKKSLKIILSITLIAFISIIFWDKLLELSVFQRFKTFDSSLELRQAVFWTAAINIFIQNWTTGIGPGNFQSYVKEHQLPLTHGQGDEMIYATQPESGWLLFLDEYGILSIFWLLFFIKPFFKKQNKFINTSILIPWIISFVSVYNLTSMHVVFLVYLTLSLINKCNRKNENHTISI